MSKTIDQKIVEMKFDNSNFERNAKTSMSTLDKLKSKLDFKGLSSGLSLLGKSAENLTFGSTISGLSQVGDGFNRMYIIGKRVLERLTDSALSFGTHLAKSLSVDQVSAGWSKYAEKTTAVQTIMSATGESIEVVNEQLEALQWFTDETSYNFTDMVNNIGKFTSAGVGLETAVTSMQGIATWAAISGANTQAASRAMYNLSQAMGVGYLGLMDWKSIELANMGTKGFKEQVLETAEAMGVLEKRETEAGQAQEYLIKGTNDTLNINNFRNSLNKKWLNNDVLNAVLNEYGAYASAVQEVQGIRGDSTASQTMRFLDKFFKSNNFKGTRDDFVEISNAIGLTVQESEALYLSWNSVGRAAFKAAQEAKTFEEAVNATKDAVSSQFLRIFESVFGDYQDAKELWTGLAEEMYNIFAAPLDSVATLLEETLYHKQSWKDMVSIFGDLGYSGEAFEQAMSKATEGTSLFTETVEKEDGAIETVGYSLEELIDKYGSLERVSERGLIDVSQLEKAMIIMGLSADEAKDLANSFASVTSAGGRVKLIEGIVAAYNRLKDILEPIKNAWKEVFPPATTETLGKLIDRFHKFTTELTFNEETLTNIHDAFKGLFDVIKVVKNTVSDIVGYASKFVGPVFKTIISFLGEFGRTVSEIIQNGNLESLFTFFSNILDKLIPTEDGINKVSDAFKGFFNVFKKEAPDGTKHFSLIEGFFNLIKKIGEKIKPIAKSIGDGIKHIINNVSLQDLGALINTGLFGKLLKSLIDLISKLSSSGVSSISDLLNGITDTFARIQEKLKGDKLKTIAISIAILVGSVFVLSRINGDDLAKAGGAIAVLLIELTKGMEAINRIKIGSDIGKKMSAFTTLAISLIILSVSLKVLSTIEPEKLTITLIAVAAMLTELSFAVKAINSIKIKSGLTKKMGALKTLSISLVILAVALRILGSMSWESIGRGLVAMGGVLLELTAFLAVLKHIGGSRSTNGLIKLSAAMVVFAIAMKIFGSMDGDSIGRALLVLGIGLTELAFAAAAMKDSLKGAGALLIMAAAIAILVPSLFLLGKIDPKELGKALLALAGALLILGIAAKVLRGTEVTLLALSASFALLGIGVAALSAGILALTTAVSVGASEIAIGLQVVISAIASLIPMVVTKIAEGIIAFVMAIANSVSSIVDAVVIIGTSILTAIGTLIPQVINTGLALLMALLTGIRDNIYQIMTVVSEIVVGFINALTEKLPEIIDAGFNFILSFVNGTANAIREKGPEVLAALSNLLSSIIELVITALQDLLGDLPVVGGKIEGFLESFKTDVRNTLAPGFAEQIGSENGQAMTDGLKAKLQEGTPRTVEAADNMKTSIANSFGTIVGSFSASGYDSAQGYANALNSTWSRNLISSASSRLAGLSVSAFKNRLDSHSPSKVFMQIGEDTGEGYVIGVQNEFRTVKNVMNKLGDTSINGMRSAIGKLGNITDFNADTQPVIRPVVDLSNVKAGANQLNTMLNNDYGVALTGTATTRNLSNSIKIQNGGNSVANAISSLKDDLNVMKNEMTGMKIVMDSGALVGSISTKMDNALGTISNYKGRGNL